MREILASTTSLRSLHVVVASGGELAAQQEAEMLLQIDHQGAAAAAVDEHNGDAGDDHVGGRRRGVGIASGFKTFHSVVEFLESNRLMEELNFTFATPLPYQMSGNKLTISGIKDTLLELETRLERSSSRLRYVNVNVAVINSLPWKMQLVKDCLGRWNHHF